MKELGRGVEGFAQSSMQLEICCQKLWGGEMEQIRNASERMLLRSVLHAEARISLRNGTSFVDRQSIGLVGTAETKFCVNSRYLSWKIDLQGVPINQ